MPRLPVAIATLSLWMFATAGPVAAQTAKGPEFDAVSVKLIDPNVQGQHFHERFDGRHLAITASLHGFIVRAYGIAHAQLLSGEPEWLNNRLYSIDAVTSATTGEAEMLSLLQGVLATRFQLRLRQEPQDMPIFALEVAAGGQKFRELKPGESPTQHDPPPPNVFGRSYSSVEDLTNSLNAVYGNELLRDRPVVDRTGLGGRYDIYLRTARDMQAENGERFPDLSHNLLSELGLRLVPGRALMPCIVIASVSEPTPN